jgi:hypothetical protein
MLKYDEIPTQVGGMSKEKVLLHSGRKIPHKLDYNVVAMIRYEICLENP